ncbi:hypothetical protein Q1695_004591 [Nippostrongylus brasiliensis]|nr:hypothetical protein Q1695_004591 [Nippostrongylus brasiliensis]
MSKSSGSGRSWNEKEEIIHGCAATILYRERRNARLLPTTAELAELLTMNQRSRLKSMIDAMLPKSQFRGGEDCSTSSTKELDFEQFIYNPLRKNPHGRCRLKRDISNGKEVFPVRVYSDTGNCVPPEEFTYISTSDFSKFREKPISKRAQNLLVVKCNCEDLVCGERCQCREMNDKLSPCTILGDGRVVVNSDATFYNTLVVGCGSKCSCKGQCRNSLNAVYLPSPFKFEVFRRSDKLGFGLRTLSNIAQGCAVVEFCGEVVGQEELTIRGHDSLDYSYCVQSLEEKEIYHKLSSAAGLKREFLDSLNYSVYIDPTRKGNIARFVSHGCFPNLTMLRYVENDLRLHRSRAILFATQPIAAGAELFFDYGMNYLSRAGFTCECGTLWCGSVTKRWQLPNASQEEIMKRSLSYFSYLRKRIRLYDSKAKQYLRASGIVRPEYDDLDQAPGTAPSTPRIDPLCVHKRNGEDKPVICYNLYCRNHAKCTCKPLTRCVPTITLD